MIRCGKSHLPECEYFTTGGCVSPFNCSYRIEQKSLTTATSSSLNSNVIYMTETYKDKEIARLTAELEKYKRALRGACKVGAVIRAEEHIQARVDCFLMQADREIEEEKKDD